jgi:hypothetical protein
VKINKHLFAEAIGKRQRQRRLVRKREENESNIPTMTLEKGERITVNMKIWKIACY